LREVSGVNTLSVAGAFVEVGDGRVLIGDLNWLLERTLEELVWVLRSSAGVRTKVSVDNEENTPFSKLRALLGEGVLDLSVIYI